jgi:hypothetical protein
MSTTRDIIGIVEGLCHISVNLHLAMVYYCVRIFDNVDKRRQGLDQATECVQGHFV